MMTNQSEHTGSVVQVVQFRFASRLNFVVFPVDPADLSAQLAAVGYQTSVQQQPVSPVIPRLRLRIGAVGEIARKDNLAIDMDPDKQILGASGNDISKVVSAYDEVHRMIEEKMGFPLSKFASFYEAIGNFEVVTGNNPLAKIAEAATMREMAKSIGAVLGFDVSPFTVRVSSRGAVPNQTEWFEITVEPLIPKSDTTYFVSVVFRSVGRDKVLSIANSVAEKVRDVIATIESQS
jgi:hypothetical protein